MDYCRLSGSHPKEWSGDMPSQFWSAPERMAPPLRYPQRYNLEGNLCLKLKRTLLINFLVSCSYFCCTALSRKPHLKGGDWVSILAFYFLAICIPSPSLFYSYIFTFSLWTIWLIVLAVRKLCLMLLKLQYAIYLNFIGAPNVGYSSVRTRNIKSIIIKLSIIFKI